MIAVSQIKRAKIKQLQNVEAVYIYWGRLYIFSETFKPYLPWYEKLQVTEPNHLKAFRWILYQFVKMYKKIHRVGLIRPDLDLTRCAIIQSSG